MISRRVGRRFEGEPWYFCGWGTNATSSLILGKVVFGVLVYFQYFSLRRLCAFLTGIQLCKYTREVKKARAARAYGTRTDATRYARGKSANFVPTREIFFVPYNIEKKWNHADEARVILYEWSWGISLHVVSFLSSSFLVVYYHQSVAQAYWLSCDRSHCIELLDRVGDVAERRVF